MGPLPSGPVVPAKGGANVPNPGRIKTSGALFLPPVRPTTVQGVAPAISGTPQMKDRSVCPNCFVPGGSHASTCPLHNTSEPVRYAMDILEKWAAVVVAQWSEINQEMSKVGLAPPRALRIGDFAVIEESDFTILFKNKTSSSIRDAILSLDFDTDTLPELRRLTIAALSDCRQKIKEAKDAALKAKLDKEMKLTENLPKFIDEFGVDLMQYGNKPDEKKEKKGKK